MSFPIKYTKKALLLLLFTFSAMLALFFSSPNQIVYSAENGLDTQNNFHLEYLSTRRPPLLMSSLLENSIATASHLAQSTDDIRVAVPLGVEDDDPVQMTEMGDVIQSSQPGRYEAEGILEASASRSNSSRGRTVRFSESGYRARDFEPITLRDDLIPMFAMEIDNGGTINNNNDFVLTAGLLVYDTFTDDYLVVENVNLDWLCLDSINGVLTGRLENYYTRQPINFDRGTILG